MQFVIAIVGLLGIRRFSPFFNLFQEIKRELEAYKKKYATDIEENKQLANSVRIVKDNIESFKKFTFGIETFTYLFSLVILFLGIGGYLNDKCKVILCIFLLVIIFLEFIISWVKYYKIKGDEKHLIPQGDNPRTRKGFQL